MIILDKPYVSGFMQKTLLDLEVPVLNCSNDLNLITINGLKTVSEKEFIKIAEAKSQLFLYCNSENSLQWIYNNLQHTKIPEFVEVFKDKLAFRKLVKEIYPHFFFQEISYNQLQEFQTSKLKKPFIIKPAIGFFSVGVHKVCNDNEWESVVELIQNEMTEAKKLYPAEVLNSSSFIIEEYIEGEEYAIDAYYNAMGEPVILNILKHPFSSDTDVSDRIYFTSKEIIQTNLKQFNDVLKAIGKATGISKFPVHVEVRVDKSGEVVPIEVNPLRFAGWCTTDLAYYAYGINVYEYYFDQKEPDWDQILKPHDDNLYCIVVADIPKGINLSEINGVNYEAYSASFSHLLELRKIDYHQYPVFAFAFIRIENDPNEVNDILQMDLGQYILHTPSTPFSNAGKSSK